MIWPIPHLRLGVELQRLRHVRGGGGVKQAPPSGAWSCVQPPGKVRHTFRVSAYGEQNG